MKSAVGLSQSKNIRNHYRLHVHTTSFLHRVIFLITSMPNFTKIFERVGLLNFRIHTNPICSIRIMTFIIFSHDGITIFCQPSEFLSVRIPDSGEPVVQKNR